jgi:hypothetical protein
MPSVSKKIGNSAKEFVLHNYLITRHLRNYLALFYIMENPDKDIIYIK